MSISQVVKNSISGLLIALISLSLITGLEAQCTDCPSEQVEIFYSADNVTPAQGDQICYTVQVRNFQSVVIFLFSVNFSSSSLRLLPNINTTISGLPSFTSSSVFEPFPPNDLDIIRVNWSGPGTTGSCLDDDSVLMELCFEVIGNPGDPILFDINNNGFNGSKVEFISEDSSGTICPVSLLTPIDGPVDSLSVPMSVMPRCTGVPQVFSRSVCGTQAAFSDGLVELNILCGTGPYTVNISNGDSFVTPDSIILIDSLPLGDYTITIVDNDGISSDPFDVTIDQSTPLEVTARIRPPRCSDDQSGSIILTTSGGSPYGTGNYRYNWNNQIFGIGSNELITLGNGTYPVTVQDSIGCTVRQEFTLQTEDPEPFVSSVRDAFCDMRNNGQIVVEGRGGTPFNGTGYNFTLQGITDAGVEISNTSTQTLGGWPFGSLAAGSYVIGVQDSLQSRSGNCDLIYTDTIRVEYSRDYSLNVTGGDASGCSSGGTARIIISAINPNNNYSYTITDEMGTTVAAGVTTSTDFLTDCLPGGNYNLNVDDGQGCSADTTFFLVACTLGFLPVEELPFCAGETGTITLNAMSDSLPIRYSWSNGDTTDSVTDLMPGSYDVTITDAANCSIIENFIIDNPEAFTVDFIPENPTCPNSLGRITAIPDGGFDPYEYEWSPDPNGAGSQAVLVDIPAGTYRVTVTDDDGCSVVDSFTLSSLTPPVASVSNLTPPRCEGDPSGAAVVSINPNTDFPGPYDFLSSTNVMGANNNFSVTDFPSGRNWVLFSDRNSGCVFDTVYIDIPDAPPLSIDPARTVIGDVDCFGGQGLDGATVNLVAAQNGVTFTWPDGDMTNVKLGLSAGTYIVTLTAGQCLSTDTVIVVQPDSLEIFVDTNLSTFPSCGGESANVVLGTRGGAPGTFSYLWENAAGNLVSTDTFANNLTVGDYSITVTDGNGCASVLPIRVDVATPVIGVLDEIIQPLCFGETGIIGIDTAFGGAGMYRFQVNTSPAQPISQPFNAQPGDYTVRIFDAEGCSFDTMVTIISPDELTVSLGSDREIELGQTLTLMANISTSTPIDTVIWTSTSAPINCASASCQDITSLPTTDQTYTIEVMDINGCIATDEVVVRVIRSLNVYIPNTFAPEGADARNRAIRVFTGAGVQVIDYLRIYDRWGNLVHIEENMAPQTNGAGNWNGTFQGRELDPGVYVYVVQLRFDGENEPTVRKGDITLIR